MQYWEVKGLWANATAGSSTGRKHCSDLGQPKESHSLRGKSSPRSSGLCQDPTSLPGRWAGAAASEWCFPHWRLWGQGRMHPCGSCSHPMLRRLRSQRLTCTCRAAQCASCHFVLFFFFFAGSSERSIAQNYERRRKWDIPVHYLLNFICSNGQCSVI